MLQRGYRYELKIRKKAARSLEDQKQYLIKNWNKLYNRPELRASKQADVQVIVDELAKPKPIEEHERQNPQGFTELERFYIGMWVYELAEEIYDDVSKTFQSGYRTAYINHRKDMVRLGVQFNVNNPIWEQYLVDRNALQLSEAQGSIAATTKKDVAKILQKGIREWQSRTQLTKEIEKATTFSKNRAKLIAVQETGKAYGKGNFLPMKQAQAQWWVVFKKRQTVQDSRVRVTHRFNQWDGWIPLDQPHSWTGELYAPSSDFNCRCTELYRIQ